MADKKTKPRGLGRGLSALMADVNPAPVSTQAEAPRNAEILVPIENVIANPNQPRRQFLQEDLDDLTASIKEKGVLQPLIVRPRPGGKYEIVAGERRWRASQAAQLHEVPVLIRDYSDLEMMEVAIIENIQRSDLNAMEEAQSYKQLMEKFGHTQEKMAEALGKSRSHIANLVRLLHLPEDVQILVQERKLSAGHARALITSDHASELAAKIVKGGLSVRATEALVKKDAAGIQAAGAKKPRKAPEKDADTRALEGDLSAMLKMKVSIDHKPGGEAGAVTISYESLDQLDELCNLLSR
ncbi:MULTISPECIES: ParB/RepB/Spo0J family partition protein [unclassified Leisingera]|uniref:ParB/RepB/Spo0J family partition protein n=1 Tax=unclassified Leisingera TaxID=2614906 RepID=UPI00030E0531|nr:MULTISPECIES: ParB/RepB/Spo0J family partition protein [unclassified Leisingera]KIC24350.1 chromosome partitioning protein ParB [Leisingera sp. ANG-S3]KIC32892.1 chromosome partitioning protein ParB [Leisingera sp. ANG-S5]KIC53066.1 chromosome partitioning protein ParB [Leisingera sp. ANG-S]KID10034.1 chromosome partitioning protein ParB [Leisingera sp. ANG1]